MNSFFLHVTDLIGQDPLVDASSQALSLVHFGKTRRDIDVLCKARVSYGSALRKLTMAAAKRPNDMKLLLAANLMCLYEVRQLLPKT
jgi:hypothetical protein